jgi:exopolyphosphatase/guanosine-5'-triphosphate,3'-diphosphate pyrophosphatase
MHSSHQARIGIIDLGSNTTRLVVLAYTPHQMYKLEDQVRERVRLSEGMGEANLLRAQPMQHTIEVLRLFRTFCEANNVPTVIATATSAVRDAVNQSSFLARVAREVGLMLRVLSGEEEAYYGYLGAINSLSFSDGILADLGGGSLELTAVRQRHLTRSVSEPLGVVRLTERFLTSDPVKPNEIAALLAHVDATLDRLDWTRSGGTLVGIGGTIRALSKVDRKRRNYPLDLAHGYTLSREALDSITEELKRLPIAQRTRIPGLADDRADVTLAGALVFQRLMERGGYKEVLICGQGLREGLFYPYLLPGIDPPLLPDVRQFSVENLARFHGYARAHSEHVRHLAWQLFDGTANLHGLGAWERELLGHAALLHDIGIEIDFYEHHLHSAYLILNSGLPGFTHRELVLIAQLARYHRKGTPSLDGYAGLLLPEDEPRLRQLASILRLAEYLERGKRQAVRGLHLHLARPWIQIEALGTGDISVELWDARRNADLFANTFNLKVELVAGAWDGQE